MPDDLKMTVRNTIQTQINEKVSETQYDVIHPETHANVVITTDDKQFISKTEKEQLQASTELFNEKGLIYEGQWTSGSSYVKNAVVAYAGKYYVSLVDQNNATPSETENTTEWKNLNLEAYIAERADKVKIAAANVESGVARELVVNGAAEDGYTEVAYTTGLTYNAKDKVLETETFKGNLVGTADAAKAADVATNYIPTDKTEAEKASIAAKFDEIDNRFEGLSQEGTTTKNALTITKDGANGVNFDGSTAVTVDIKQNYGYADIVGLMKDGKIDAALLPDSIVGQLEYMGTWTAAIEGLTPAKGQYYIAAADVNVNPDGTEGPEYSVGDWAVYNGAAWDKVDNTDAVTMVNGQKGAVQTYKGGWTSENKYYVGDIVKNEGLLYICNTENNDGTFDAAKWDLFGRTYTGEAGIKVENGVISHSVVVEEDSEEAVTLTKESTIDVPEITKDAQGHITKVNLKKITLGEEFIDTVRPVKVEGTEVLDKATKDALDIYGSEKIAVVYADEKLTVSHKETLGAEADLTSTPDELKAGSTFKVPSFKVDASGHITEAELKEVKIAENLVAHEHFEVKVEEGVNKIGAYTGIEDAEALAGLGAGKFYKGAAVPTATEELKLNAKFYATELYQGANKVLDQTAKIYAGNGYNAETQAFDRPLEGSFDAANNRFNMAETGIASGVYSAVQVNRYGLATAGGQIIEFGSEVNADPSESLAIGGLFFRKLA